MSDTDHGAPGATAAHGTGHDAGDGHDDHGHAADALGPIDWTMWAVGLLGVLVAAIVVVGFVIATQGKFGLS
jgi:hypothetical protein